MSDRGRRIANLVARALRRVRRDFFPRFDTRKSRLAHAYQRWASNAARLGYVDGVVGHRMYLDERDSLRLSVARLIEPGVTRFVQEAVRPGQVAIDLGANIGYFTLLLGRQVGPAGRVYAFEPDSTNFELLTRNVELNGYSNVTLVPSAVWSETGPLRLYLSDDNRGDHRVYDTAEERPSVAIDAVRLDDYLADDALVADFIKMDVQGAELHALEGMQGLLARSPRVTMVSEFWPAALERAGSPARAFVDRMLGLGFSPCLVGDDVETPRAIAPRTLLAEYTAENDRSADVVWRRA
jgi:FkbM family methyltransferase